jgi:xylulokinase
VLEGVAFGVKRHIDIMQQAAGVRLERLVASGGGARTRLWLKIKASVYNVPIEVPREAECSIVGCAVLAAVASGRHASLQDAAQAMVSYGEEVLPEPRWVDTYARMQPVFEKLYFHSQTMYDDLDRLSEVAP